MQAQLAYSTNLHEINGVRIRDIFDGAIRIGQKRLSVLLQQEMVDIERQLHKMPAGQKLHDTLKTR